MREIDLNQVSLNDRQKIPTQMAERKEPQLTPEQKIVADALSYLDYTLILDEAATHYATWQTDDRNGRYQGTRRREDFNDHKERALLALDDLHFARQSTNPTEAVTDFNQTWLDMAEGITSTLDRFSPQIRSSKVIRNAEAADFTPDDIASYTKDIVKMMGKITPEQQEKIQEISNLSPEDRVKFRKVLAQAGLTAALYGIMYWGSDHLSDGIGIAVGSQFELFNNSYHDWRTYVAIGAAEFAYYGTEVLKYMQTKNMVKDPKMTVYHPMAKAGHLFASKTTDDPKKIDNAIRAGYLANPQLYYQLLKWYSALPIPSIFVAGDVAATVLNIVHLAGVELEHRRVHRDDEDNSGDTGMEIFQPEQVSS